MVAIAVQLTIELDSAIYFCRWVPRETKDDIICNDGDVEIRIGLSEQFKRHFQPSENEIPNHLNIGADLIRLSAHRVTISDKLANFIKRHISHAATGLPPADVHNEYLEIARRLHKEMLRRLNRFLGYAYAIKGQWHAEGIEYDPDNASQFFIRYEAKAIFEDGSSYRFYPDSSHRIRVYITDKQTCIAASEWDDVKEFVAGIRRTPLVGHLLANAQALMSKGYNRNAVIEAVSALETALSKFRREWSNASIDESIQKRTDASGIEAVFEKVGFRGAFAVLLPMLFDDAVLPTKTLTVCREAIDLRNNLIHNGSRDANEADVRRMISSIKDCCTRLNEIAQSNKTET
jgi:hypothetical protein